MWRLMHLYWQQNMCSNMSRAMMQMKEGIAGSGQKIESSSSTRDAPDIGTDEAC